MGRAQRPIRGRRAPVPRTMNNRVNRAGTAFAPRRWRTRFALLALIFGMKIITTRSAGGGQARPPLCLAECFAFYICRKTLRDLEMARHWHRAIFTFAESESANVAKPPSEGGAEQTGRDVSRFRRTAPACGGGRRGSAPAGSRGWPPPDFRSG